MKLTKVGRNILLMNMINNKNLKIENDRCYFRSKYYDELNFRKKYLNKNGIKTSNIKKEDDHYIFETNKYKFISVYEKAYLNSNKNLCSNKFLMKLNKLNISILYLNAGTINKKKIDGKIKSINLILKLNLSKEAAEIIIKYFKENYDIKFNIFKSGSRCNLRCGTKEANKFLLIVNPYLSGIESIHYKLNK